MHPTQNGSTEKSETPQNVAIEPVQTVPTQPPECLQNVSTEWPQTVATPDTYRDNNRENKETEITSREHHTIWTKTIEAVKEAHPLEEVEARLADTTLLELTDTAARIGVTTPFAIAWLERRLYSQIAKAMKEVVGKDVDLQFIAAS